MRMAASPGTGHLYSQMAQPMQRERITFGRRTVTMLPSGSLTSASSRTMALSGTGQTSSQTMQSRAYTHGMQRF